MKLNPGLKTGREGRRLKTQKQRNPKARKSYHPRSLYRGLGVEYSKQARTEADPPETGGRAVKE